MASTDLPKRGETTLRFDQDLTLSLYPQSDARLEVQRVPGFGETAVIAWGADAIVRGHEGLPAEGTLLPFLELEPKADECLVAFARSYGPLGILPHVTNDTLDHAEPVAVWREVIRQCNALMGASAAAFDGVEPDRADVLVVLRGNSSALADPEQDWRFATQLYRYEPSHLKPRIGYRLSVWLSAAGVTPLVDWGMFKDNRLGVASVGFGQLAAAASAQMARWDAIAETKSWNDHVRDWNSRPIGPHQRVSPLFAALVVQMANVLSTPGGVRRCSICKKLFIPHRKYRSNTEGRYCSPKCKAKQQQEWSRNYYRKEAEKSDRGRVRADYRPRA